MSNYVPTHVHSCYSVRDSIAKIPDLVSRAKELGCPAIAITEHGFMGSAYKFYKECKKQEIKPILGVELYYCNDINEKEDIYHLCAYAKNNNGYKNLCRLSSEAYVNGFYRKPRIDFNLLTKYKDDIIISTACMQSIFAQLIISGNKDEANKEIDRFHKVFGDDFYLEVHNHGILEEIEIKNHFKTYGREKGIKIITGTDVHMVNESDKEIHNIFKQIAYNSVGSDKDDSFTGNGYHLLSYDEMLERFDKEDIDNTLEFIDKCNVKFEFTGYSLPNFEIEEEQDAYEYLKEKCYTSLKQKKLDKDEKYLSQLEYELNMLHLADLENYLLIVSDYCNWAKNNDIPVGPGRGSMGGSIVSWLTGITEVDPLKYGLLFGRAINVGRCLQYNFGV